MSEKILVASDNIESYQRAILSHPLHQFDLICVSDLDELFVRWNEGDRDYLAIFIEHNNDKFDFKKIAQQLARVNNSSHLPIIAEVPTSLIGMLPDDVRATADAYYTLDGPHEHLTAILRQLMVLKALNLKANSVMDNKNDLVGGSSDVAERLKQVKLRAAQNDLPIVIEGPLGVDKTAVAYTVFKLGKRLRSIFKIIDCSGLTDNELGLQLFGDRKNAGIFQSANGGTVFLKSLTYLSPDLQESLLEFLTCSEFYSTQLGKRIKTNIKLIISTDLNLIEEVKKNRLREDLYYRLHVFPIMVPALSSHLQDIESYVYQLAASYSRLLFQNSGLIDHQALRLLTDYDWPGNQRQLKRVLLNAVVLSGDGHIKVQHLPQLAAQIFGTGYLASAHEAEDYGLVRADTIELDHSQMIEDVPQNTRFNTLSEPGPVDLRSVPVLDSRGEIRPLSQVEEELIRFAISFYNGRMTHVARQLGIGRSTLYRKLKDYDIDPNKPIDIAS
jgi:DNA-binding NtrC family response regulator